MGARLLVPLHCPSCRAPAALYRGLFSQMCDVSPHLADHIAFVTFPLTTAHQLQRYELHMGRESWYDLNCLFIYDTEANFVSRNNT